MRSIAPGSRVSAAGTTASAPAKPFPTTPSLLSTPKASNRCINPGYIERSNSNSSKESVSAQPAAKVATISPRATGTELVKALVASKGSISTESTVTTGVVNKSSLTSVTAAKLSNTGKRAPSSTSSSPEERLDSLIKSLSKADVVASKNTALEIKSESIAKPGPSADKFVAENTDDGVSKTKLNKKAVNGVHSSAKIPTSNIKVVNNKLTSNSTSKSAKEEIVIVNDFHSVTPNNNRAKVPIVIPDKKCNILKAKELEQRRTYSAKETAIDEDMCATCNGQEKTVIKADETEKKSNIESVSKVLTDTCPNKCETTARTATNDTKVSIQTFIGHHQLEHSNFELFQETLEEDDDELPLIGSGSSGSADPSNITIIPVHSGAQNVAAALKTDSILGKTHHRSPPETPPQYHPTNPFASDITNLRIAEGATMLAAEKQFQQKSFPGEITERITVKSESNCDEGSNLESFNNNLPQNPTVSQVARGTPSPVQSPLRNSSFSSSVSGNSPATTIRDYYKYQNAGTGRGSMSSNSNSSSQSNLQPSDDFCRESLSPSPILVETSFACANPVTRSVSVVNGANKPVPNGANNGPSNGSSFVSPQACDSVKRSTSMSQTCRTVMTTEL